MAWMDSEGGGNWSPEDTPSGYEVALPGGGYDFRYGMGKAPDLGLGEQFSYRDQGGNTGLNKWALPILTAAIAGMAFSGAGAAGGGEFAGGASSFEEAAQLASQGGNLGNTASAFGPGVDAVGSAFTPGSYSTAPGVQYDWAGRPIGSTVGSTYGGTALGMLPGTGATTLSIPGFNSALPPSTMFDPNTGSPGSAPVQDMSRGMASPATLSGVGESGNLVNQMMGVPKWLSGAANASGVGGGGGVFSMAKNLFDVGSGIYGLTQQQKQRKMAEAMFSNSMQNADPYAGARNLMANPNSVTGMPGYQFGLDQGRLAIARQGAASGGGGNEAIAAARYTPEYAQNFYNNEVARQMQLGAGQGQLNVNQAQVGNQIMGGANNLASSSLGSIGYGLTRMGGMPNQTSQYAALLDRMFRGG